MEFIKNLLKRWSSRRAAKNHLRACKLAEKRYRNTRHTQQFVISHPNNPCALLVLNKDEFIAMRKKLGLTSAQLTLSELKRGCWYHTANKKGIDKMDARDMIKRKMTYLRLVLIERGLIKEETK